jgi:hypothetical protein
MLPKALVVDDDRDVLETLAEQLTNGDILENEAAARWRVGGMSGEVSGATKLATWKAFLGEVAEMGLGSSNSGRCSPASRVTWP